MNEVPATGTKIVVIPAKRAVTYCSFATAEDGCLGVCILTGILDPLAASNKAWDLGLNPGGQFLAFSCQETDQDVPHDVFEAMWANREVLLSAKEARDLFGAESIQEHEEAERPNPNGT